MEGLDVMHLHLFRPAACLALWLAGKMLAANAGPLARAWYAVIVGAAVEEPAEHYFQTPATLMLGGAGFHTPPTF